MHILLSRFHHLNSRIMLRWGLITWVRTYSNILGVCSITVNVFLAHRVFGLARRKDLLQSMAVTKTKSVKQKFVYEVIWGDVCRAFPYWSNLSKHRIMIHIVRIVHSAMTSLTQYRLRNTSATIHAHFYLNLFHRYDTQIKKNREECNTHTWLCVHC